jgi:enoyl-CoA hydratase
MQTHATLSIREDLATIVFACEDELKPPTLDEVALQELDEKLGEIEVRAQDLRAVIVRSVAEKYFIVGANIAALGQIGRGTIVSWVELGHRVFNRLEGLPLPVIARVDGYALGGGLELAMACDLTVASSRARFGQPEANLGLVPGWGGTHRLPRRVGLSRAKELTFTGRMIDAAEAHAIGLADYVAEPHELDDMIAGILDAIRSSSAVAVSQVKQLLNASQACEMAACVARESAASLTCFVDGDASGRVQAFIESRSH